MTNRTRISATTTPAVAAATATAAATHQENPGAPPCPRDSRVRPPSPSMSAYLPASPDRRDPLCPPAGFTPVTPAAPAAPGVMAAASAASGVMAARTLTDLPGGLPFPGPDRGPLPGLVCHDPRRAGHVCHNPQTTATGL